MVVKTKEASLILKKQLELISPDNEEIKGMNKKANEMIKIISNNLKKNKISAQVFIGGSFAKKTMIRKDKYDVDLFIRFDKKYVSYDENGKLSDLLEKSLPKNAKRIHGSRDYFNIVDGNLTFEIIPTIKVNDPLLARNITDLSYFHVNYTSKKINANPRLVNEIRLAKAFAYFADCYGAESYINGFSGYALELLIIHYKSLINFMKAILEVDLKKGKIIIDDEKYYKNKKLILREINESKLHSPIIVIDPTFKQRNALAALSDETFFKFQKACRMFLAAPSDKFFVVKDKEGDMRKKFGESLIELKLTTDKQAGDIAGTKLKKFYGFFIRELERYFNIEKSEFVYDEDNNVGNIYLAIKQKKEIVFHGPPIEMKEPLAKFKKEHKNIKVIKGQAFAYEKSIDFDGFMNLFKNQKQKIIEEMDIREIIKG